MKLQAQLMKPLAAGVCTVLQIVRVPVACKHSVPPDSKVPDRLLVSTATTARSGLHGT